MASSEHEAFWRFATSRLNADDPLGAGPVRNIAVSNLLHLHDESTQFLANFVARNTASRLSLTLAAANVYELLWASPPFPVQVKSGGEPFKAVCRLGGSISNNSHTATFLAIIRRRAQAPWSTTVDVAASMTATATSTTDGWLSESVLTLDRDRVGTSLETVRVEETNGGPVGESEWCMLRVDVFVKVTDVAGIPRLTGLSLRQYIGT